VDCNDWRCCYCDRCFRVVAVRLPWLGHMELTDSVDLVEHCMALQLDGTRFKNDQGRLQWPKIGKDVKIHLSYKDVWMNKYNRINTLFSQ